jgi:LmbE family N-acetylglucosaminyl deacetylase
LGLDNPNPEDEMSKTILAIEAHADDATIGAGALLLEAAQKGHRVVIVTVASDFETWNTSLGRGEQIKSGLNELASEQGMERIFLDLPYHQTSGDDLTVKKKLGAICADLSPDIAFIHHHEDHWPDHKGSALAAHDALMFTAGLSGNVKAKPCPLIYSFDISPRQTYRFQPDVFYDIGHIMQEYMDMIHKVCDCYFGHKPKDSTVGSFKYADEDGKELSLGIHGLRRFADCVRFGNMAQVTFALGFKKVWGKQLGPDLF